ncbi:hypothetical protein FRX31_004924, partial [Thalictrum thalictroides]
MPTQVETATMPTQAATSPKLAEQPQLETSSTKAVVETHAELAVTLQEVAEQEAVTPQIAAAEQEAVTSRVE